MAIYRATHILARKSGKPEDAVHNVWHFAGPGAPVNGEMTRIITALQQFYQSISGLLAESVARTDVHKTQVATLTQGGAGDDDDVVSKVLMEGLSGSLYTPGAGNGIPAECAVVLSFRAEVEGVPEEQGVTRPASRRRGRVSIGPVTSASFVQATVANGAEVTVAEPARNTILDAYQAMVAAVNAEGLNRTIHTVYSRQDALIRRVVHAHIDNAPDIVRTRGIKGFARSERVINQLPL